MYIKLFKVH